MRVASGSSGSTARGVVTPRSAGTSRGSSIIRVIPTAGSRSSIRQSGSARRSRFERAKSCRTITPRSATGRCRADAGRAARTRSVAPAQQRFSGAIMSLRLAVIASCAFVFAGSRAAEAQGTPARCAALSRLRVPGYALEITKAESIAAGPAAQGRGRGRGVDLPDHCRVDGMIDRRTTTDGKSYGIGFAVTLPDNWNGRFLFQGGGGLNGTVGLPLGVQAAGGTPGLVRGFAVVSTDTGHQSTGGAFDGAFMRDQQATLDFEYVAVGRVALLAKQIVEQYYGRPADHSYFAGCSTGGRKAMLMAQRYPTYFDGIVAGAPAMRTGFSGLGDRWVAVTLNQIAPKDAGGKPIPSQIFSESDK